VQHSPQSRPLDPLAIALTVALCLIWGFNQVAVKLAIHDIPPLIQSTVRSITATILVAAWVWFRGIPLFKRDGTFAAGALVFGEHIDTTPSALAIGALAYQAVWVVCVTYMAWFALIVRYSASRLSSFTFLTPLFGVVAGHVVLNEPLSPPFALAVALVAIGLVLVNRPR
jgi:drug/metabolite transporter (DMT)-like permease